MNLLSLKNMNTEKVNKLLELAADIKLNPNKYSNSLKGKSLLMFFAKPSLRTRISFDVGIKQLGGFSIVIDTNNTPLGKKETIEDTAKVCSKYVNCIMARMFKHESIVKLAKNTTIPVINGLTDDYHPCQILSDLLTIKEKKGNLKGLKLCFLGDGLNNITHSLLIGCALVGINISIGCPSEAMPKKEVIEYAKEIANSKVIITNDPVEAIKDADIVYTDTWMSYHIKLTEKEQRIQLFKPYQVNAAIVKNAKQDFTFMNCLPALRGYEQTTEVIDGPNSVVFDQAENRLHMQKAILLELLK
jgi:ornithine carbamoyltransferase